MAQTETTIKIQEQIQKLPSIESLKDFFFQHLVFTFNIKIPRDWYYVNGKRISQQDIKRLFTDKNIYRSEWINRLKSFGLDYPINVDVDIKDKVRTIILANVKSSNYYGVVINGKLVSRSLVSSIEKNQLSTETLLSVYQDLGLDKLSNKKIKQPINVNNAGSLAYNGDLNTKTLLNKVDFNTLEEFAKGSTNKPVSNRPEDKPIHIVQLKERRFDLDDD